MARFLPVEPHGRAVALELGRLGATVGGTPASEAGAAAIHQALADAGS